MQRKSFEKMACPIARSLERVGEWWSILIMRDALHGMTRFDEFQNSLGIAPNMLTRRLNSLVDAGLLERRRYNDHPPRHEYVPTVCGRDFFPVLVTLLTWGNKHFAHDGQRVVIANRNTGAAVDPILVERATRVRVDESNYTLAAGPDASPRTRQRYAAIATARPSGHSTTSQSRNK
jgi:DNA-binding HxlR family transcriptional regulator